MAKVGRPRTKTGNAAAKHRTESREEYRSLPEKKKQSRVSKRSKPAQRKADAKRLAKAKPQRNTYHRNEARALKDVPKGSKCAKCSSTRNVQRHVVNGKFKEYLCGKCNTNAIGKS